MKKLTRRKFIKNFVLSIAAFKVSSCAIDKNRTETNYSDPDVADRWITEWMKNQRAVEGPLNLTRFADPVYIVTKEIKWKPNPKQESTYKAITVPRGFVTDFASIPRIFWSALRPDGLYSYAAIIHDYLYWDQSVPRATADAILRFAMEDFRINPMTIPLIHKAVRLGGQSAWDENARLKAAGEKRLLKRFPEDPTIHWVDWKKRKDVF